MKTPLIPRHRKYAPDVLYDIDGVPMSVRRDLAPTPWKALRVAFEDTEWMLEDIEVHWVDEDAGRGWYKRDELRHLIADTKVKYMRPWNETDDADSDWGEDAWYWCQPDHPEAVEYWELPY